MARELLRRLIYSFGTLLAVSFGVFCALRLLPGDPVISRLGSSAGVSTEAIDSMRAEFGLDRPLLVQYWDWLSSLLTGDLSTSYSSSTTVSSQLGSALPVTLELTLLTTVVSVIIGVAAALATATKPDGILGRIAMASATFGIAMPPFVGGIALVVLFSVRLGWLPARGYVPLGEGIGANLEHMVLPVVAMTIVAAPLVYRFLRSSLNEVLQTAYIRTARGKGASQTQVLVNHALRNAVVPALTVLGMVVGVSLGGVVVVEYVFGLPGLGSLAVAAIQTRDYPIVQATTVLISAMFILVNLVVDLSYGLVDPRLRLGRREP